MRVGINRIAEHPLLAAQLTDTFTFGAARPVNDPMMGAGNLVTIHIHSLRLHLVQRHCNHFLGRQDDVIARRRFFRTVYGALEHDAVYGAVDSLVSTCGDDDAITALELVNVAHTRTVASGLAPCCASSEEDPYCTAGSLMLTRLRSILC